MEIKSLITETNSELAFIHGFDNVMTSCNDLIMRHEEIDHDAMMFSVSNRESRDLKLSIAKLFADNYADVGKAKQHQVIYDIMKNAVSLLDAIRKNGRKNPKLLESNIRYLKAIICVLESYIDSSEKGLCALISDIRSLIDKIRELNNSIDKMCVNIDILRIFGGGLCDLDKSESERVMRANISYDQEKALENFNKGLKRLYNLKAGITITVGIFQYIVKMLDNEVVVDETIKMVDETSENIDMFEKLSRTDIAEGFIESLNKDSDYNFYITSNIK